MRRINRVDKALILVAPTLAVIILGLALMELLGLMTGVSVLRKKIHPQSCLVAFSIHSSRIIIISSIKSRARYHEGMTQRKQVVPIPQIRMVQIHLQQKVTNSTSSNRIRIYIIWQTSHSLLNTSILISRMRIMKAAGEEEGMNLMWYQGACLSEQDLMCVSDKYLGSRFLIGNY